MTEDKVTLKVLGAEMGIGRNRVWQIEAMALSALRRPERRMTALSNGLFAFFPKLAAKVYGFPISEQLTRLNEDRERLGLATYEGL